MDREQGSYLRKIIEDMVMEKLDLSKEVEDEQVYRLIDHAINQLSREQYISVSDRVELRSAVFNSMRGLDVLTPLLKDENITEIMINGHNNIFVEENGSLHKVALAFESKEKYHNVIQQVVAGCNRIVNESSPIVDARLLDGSRVNVVLSPISLDGSTMTIRKFPKEAFTMDKLIQIGSLDRETSELLKLLVKSGYNIFVSGGTGSGKTTFLNALSDFIPKSERIITIEDSAELQIKGVENLVRMEVRNANVEGKNAITMQDLIKSSLRMRPNRIIVGEVRGGEALDMLQGLNTGHDGSICTGHANSARDMLTRLEVMVLMAVDMPVYALRGQIASALEIIVHLGRLRDNSRRVMEIVEVLNVEQGEIKCNTLFKFQEKHEDIRHIEEGEVEAMESGQEQRKMKNANIRRNYHPDKDEFTHIRVQGQLVPKHQLQQVNKLMQAGYYNKFLCLMDEIKIKNNMERPV